ncbi:MAG: hypothetical protein QM775_24460 [Pirellulales bacterium]
MLTSSVLFQIIATLDRPQDGWNPLVIADVRRGDEPRLYEVFFRPWYREGYRIVGEPIPSAETVRRRDAALCDRDRCQIALLTDDSEAARSYRWTDLNWFTVLREEDFAEQRLDAAHSRSQSFALTLFGREQTALTVPSFPTTLTLKTSSLPEYALFGIAPGDPAQGLPPQQWFQLPEAESQRHVVMIDVEPHQDCDRWRLSLGDGRTLPATNTPRQTPRHLDRLILIVDRTCPSSCALERCAASQQRHRAASRQ